MLRIRLLPAALAGFVTLGATFALGGCSDLLSVENLRTEIEPHAFYEQLWRDVRGCSGHFEPARFERIRWFVTPTFPGKPGMLGQWNERHEITLRVDAQFNEDVVKHELLHELLGGDPTHADPAWEMCQLPIGLG